MGKRQRGFISREYKVWSGNAWGIHCLFYTNVQFWMSLTRYSTSLQRQKLTYRWWNKCFLLMTKSTDFVQQKISQILFDLVVTSYLFPCSRYVKQNVWYVFILYLHERHNFAFWKIFFNTPIQSSPVLSSHQLPSFSFLTFSFFNPLFWKIYYLRVYFKRKWIQDKLNLISWIPEVTDPSLPWSFIL